VRLQDRLTEYELDLAGGDFNGSALLRDEVQESFQTHTPPKATFPSDAPMQPLDQFILKKGKFSSVRIEVPDTGTLSDHLPVLLTVDSP
jgi:endonuclease/exonuclease/phosphatase family metal-dependent hydrolase